MSARAPKYVFVTGGVVSALGKGIVAASLGRLLKARGLRVQANDVAFARGDGPLVSGPGEALLLALSGRVVALDELAGEGLVTLRSRVGN